MRITVKTGNADKPAPDITDSLLGSTESMIARAKSELYGSVDAYMHSVSMPLQNMINTGELGEVIDSQYGETHRGKVNGVSIDIGETSIDLRVDMERPV